MISKQRIALSVCVLVLSVAVASCTTSSAPAGEVTVLTNLQGLTKVTPPVPPQPIDSCTVEVGRTRATAHHHRGLQEYVTELNDRVRAITKLPIDLFVGEEGKYVVKCSKVADGRSVVVDPSTGAAMLPYYQTHGMRPRNYFTEDLRPGRNDKIVRPVQLSPPPAVPGMRPNIAAAITQMPAPNFSFDTLGTVVPNSTVSVGDGVYQFNNVVRLEASYSIAPNAAVVPGESVMQFVQTGVAYPLTCEWNLPSCPPEMRASPIQERCIDPIKCAIEPLESLVASKRAKGIAITEHIFDELLGLDPNAIPRFDTDGTSRMRFTDGGDDSAGINLLTISGIVQVEGRGCSIVR